jgi:hypothetical protein
MGYLDQVLNLKKEGKSDEEIKKILSESGVTPKDIDEAMKQAEIKSAISEFGEDEELQPSMMDGEEPEEPNIPIPNQEEVKKEVKKEIEEPKDINPLEISQKEFNIKPDYYFSQEPSFSQGINQEQQQYTQEEQYPPYPPYQKFYSPNPQNPEYENYPENIEQQVYSQEEANEGIPSSIPYPREEQYNYSNSYGDYQSDSLDYPQYQNDFSSTTSNDTQIMNTDNIIEIANQIFSEKIKKIQNENNSFSNELSILKSKLGMIDERLRKIENIIEKLQLSILEKIGSYGQNLESVKKEINLMQDSFSKFVSKR